MEYSINNPALSLLMKHLVMRQRQKPNFSAFHWSPHGSLVSIEHTFVSPSAFSRRAVVSYWRMYVHEVLVNRLGGLSLPRKSVVRLTERPDMTLDVYRGRKTTRQQQQQQLVSIGQNFITTRVVHLPKRTETSLITESDQSGPNHQLLQICTARTAWFDSDQALQAVHSCISWFHLYRKEKKYCFLAYVRYKSRHLTFPAV